MTNIKKIKNKENQKKNNNNNNNKVKKTNTNNNNKNNNNKKKDNNKKNEVVAALIKKKNNKNNNNKNENKNKLKVIVNNNKQQQQQQQQQQQEKEPKEKEEEQDEDRKEITNDEDDEKYNLWNPKPIKSNITTTNTTTTNSKKQQTNLQNEMSEKLKGSRFRWLNESLYTSHSKDSFKEFSEDRTLFDQYHSGFKSQVEVWPINPLDLIIDDLLSIKSKKTIADLGCGEAKLSERLSNKHIVKSFDLVAINDRVTACDISNLPLKNESIDIAVFCLSLMGTNFIDFLMEAERVLIKGGLLKIAEIESRITDVNQFISEIEQLGFKLVKKNLNNQYFSLFEFTKLLKKDQQFIKNLKKLKQQQQSKNGDNNDPILKPCLYKKR